jgi:hypothetical protein
MVTPLTRVEKAEFERLSERSHQGGPEIDVLQAPAQILDGWLRVRKLDDDVEELVDEDLGVSFTDEMHQTTAKRVDALRFLFRVLVDHAQPLQHFVV